MAETTTDRKHPDSTHQQISANVQGEVEAELSRFEANTEEGSTVEVAAADVVQRLYDVYGVSATTRTVVEHRFTVPAEEPWGATWDDFSVAKAWAEKKAEEN